MMSGFKATPRRTGDSPGVGLGLVTPLILTLPLVSCGTEQATSPALGQKRF
jgi:hypothetical protein